MTQTELHTALLTVGLPLNYSHFKKSQAPPFIVYKYRNRDSLTADDLNADSVDNFDIELYTGDKDPVNEALLEAVLIANGLLFGKTENWIPEEDMFQIAYEVQII